MILSTSYQIVAITKTFSLPSSGLVSRGMLYVFVSDSMELLYLGLGNLLIFVLKIIGRLSVSGDCQQIAIGNC